MRARIAIGGAQLYQILGTVTINRGNAPTEFLL